MPAGIGYGPQRIGIRLTPEEEEMLRIGIASDPWQVTPEMENRRRYAMHKIGQNPMAPPPTPMQEFETVHRFNEQMSDPDSLAAQKFQAQRNVREAREADARNMIHAQAMQREQMKTPIGRFEAMMAALNNAGGVEGMNPLGVQFAFGDKAANMVGDWQGKMAAINANRNAVKVQDENADADRAARVEQADLERGARAEETAATAQFRTDTLAEQKAAREAAERRHTEDIAAADARAKGEKEYRIGIEAQQAQQRTQLAYEARLGEARTALRMKYPNASDQQIEALARSAVGPSPNIGIATPAAPNAPAVPQMGNDPMGAPQSPLPPLPAGPAPPLGPAIDPLQIQIEQTLQQPPGAREFFQRFTPEMLARNEAVLRQMGPAIAAAFPRDQLQTILGGQYRDRPSIFSNFNPFGEDPNVSVARRNANYDVLRSILKLNPLIPRTDDNYGWFTD